MHSKCHVHARTQTQTHANNNKQGGRVGMAACCCQDGARGRHPGKVRPRLQGAVNAAWKIRATPRGNLERQSPIHVLRGRVTDRHVPYTESTHRNKKRNKTNLTDVIAWLKLGADEYNEYEVRLGERKEGGQDAACNIDRNIGIGRQPKVGDVDGDFGGERGGGTGEKGGSET